MIRSFFKKVSERQEGAYLLEFLGGLTASLVIMLIVFQLLYVLLVATMFNNALQATAQETSVQGGLNGQAMLVYRTALPNMVWQNTNITRSVLDNAGNVAPTPAPATVDTYSERINGVDRGRRGREITKFGDPIQLAFDYNMPTPLGGLFGPSNNSIEFKRKVTIASQSAKEN